MKTATSKDTADMIMGSGFDQFSWWRGVDRWHVWDDNTEPFADWYACLLAEDTEDEDRDVRVDINHRIVMRAARKIASMGADEMERKYISNACQRECRHLVFNPDECDFDAATADELVQYIAYGRVVCG
jgi:hypothetical protein